MKAEMLDRAEQLNNLRTKLKKCQDDWDRLLLRYPDQSDWTRKRQRKECREIEAQIRLLENHLRLPLLESLSQALTDYETTFGLPATQRQVRAGLKLKVDFRPTP